MTISQYLEGRWAVLLFYRGHWCPYCRQQLLDLQRAKAQLNELGAEVVALSVDSLAHAQQTVERHRLTFPVLYGLDARAMAEMSAKPAPQRPGSLSCHLPAPRGEPLAWAKIPNSPRLQFCKAHLAPCRDRACPVERHGLNQYRGVGGRCLSREQAIHLIPPGRPHGLNSSGNAQ